MQGVVGALEEAGGGALNSSKCYIFWGTCKGTTKAGTNCKRTIVYANGYCRAHGGNSTEFMLERFAKIKSKALRRVKRYQRRMQHAKATLGACGAVSRSDGSPLPRR
jgi:hypothetical protein